MKARVLRSREHALTLPEVLLVLGLLVILAGLLLPALAPARSSRNRQGIICMSNLKQIGLAMRIFSHDHYDKFPWVVPKEEGGSMEYTNSVEVFQHFLVASNELSSPKVLRCPMDAQRQRTNDWQGLSNSNLSYFAGLEANEARPQTILSGDRTLSLSGTNAVGLVVIQKESDPGIRGNFHEGRINLAFGDGSVQQLTETKARNWLLHTNDLPMRLAIP